MPELPEVDIVVEGLKKVILDKKINQVKLFRKKIRVDINESFETDILNTTIKSIRRRSKYIIVNLSNNKSILIHLGMSGKLTVEKNLKENELKKHSHILINLSDGLSLVYNDVRRFGLALSMNTDDIDNHKYIRNIGIEPLSEEFDGKQLYELLKNKTCVIKLAILDQTLVCGLGNIYACEALFYSQISPVRKANSLTKKECIVLVKNIKDILRKSIKAGGSTISDYVQSDGSMGGFQNDFAVYARDGEPCKVCKTLIRRIKQGGRSTFYCEDCQK